MNTADHTTALRWLAAAFKWQRVAALLVAVALPARFLTGVAFHLLSVPRGWSGIATLVLLYAALFLAPAQVGQRWASLAAIALGRTRSNSDRPWPSATRRGVAATMLLAATPIVIAVATMPRSGRVLDNVTWALFVGFIIRGLQLLNAAGRARQRVERRARESVRRAAAERSG